MILLFIKARLRGNLLGFKPLDLATEPILFICEKVNVERSLEQKNLLSVKQNNKQILLGFVTEKKCDEWVLKVKNNNFEGFNPLI